MSQSHTNDNSAKASLAERIARKDQLIVLGAVGVVVAMSGIYTVAGVGMNMSALEMTRMAAPFGGRMNMSPEVTWTLSYGTLVGLMWWIMMIAMMTPSAAPTLLLFTALKRHGKDRTRASSYGALFLVGYLLMWALFAIAAAFLQWLLETIGLISGSLMTISSKALTGSVLLGVGLYQFSNLKNACLKHCRSPASFLSEHNRPGFSGALRMGAHHGGFCLGCCWALMALLFVGGIMNLFWITGLAIYVIAEKYVPNGVLLSRIAGVSCILAGGFYVLQSAV
ncbi:hypothetical protein A9Q96_12310 [Rhodobacterales bacterium 52_120_T64]|nr:hypothetical protein A9Q96_12310 [Rhodobacterales bacterium 52_120_T64]